MSFIARAEITVDALPHHVFDRLADLASWPRWMPPSFVPSFQGLPPPLQRGDRLRVKIAGAPVRSILRVTTLDHPRELAWCGGVRGLLRAEHRFLFEAAGEGRTRIRSVETWNGALAGVLRRVVQPLAERIGRAQLEGLARTSTRGG